MDGALVRKTAGRALALAAAVLIGAALALAVSAVQPERALAATSGTWHGVSYDMDGTGNVTFHAGKMTGDFLENDAFYKNNVLKNATSIKADGGVVLPADSTGLFCCCEKLTFIDMSDFDSSRVTNMADMFGGCSSLTSLDVSSLETSRVTNMAGMFYRCRSLATLDVTSFGTSRVTDMSYMFEDCQSLTSLDLSSFDTSRVSNMYLMFAHCTSLAMLDVTSFDTSKVTDMGSMFADCQSLTSLNISNFDTSKVENMNCMFSGCLSLTSLDLSSLDTSQTTDMDSMFWGCPSLTSLDLSSFDTSKVKNMHRMFQDCPSLIILDLSGFDTSQVWDMGEMFADCSSLMTIQLGRGFSFCGSGTSRLCSLTQYEGEWLSSADGKRYSYNNIPNNVAATYTRIAWSSDLFSTGSTAYNARLALAAAQMCDVAQGSDDSKIVSLLKDDWGFNDAVATNYWGNGLIGGSAAFTVAHDTFTVDGKKTIVLVVVPRGSKTATEFLGDFSKGGDKDFLEQKVWDNVYDFEEKVWAGIDDYLDNHPKVKSASRVKILVAGHSLGGASADMVAARLTKERTASGSWWKGKAAKKDIYCYTFGAINVLSKSAGSISSGFENIHNVYNYYDSFGPHGNFGLGTATSSPGAKWGHADEFKHDYGETSPKSSVNHDIANYWRAVSSGEVTCKNSLTLTKAKTANPMIVKARTVTVKYAKVKKKSQTLARSKVLTVKKAMGEVTYTKKSTRSGSKKIAIAKKTGNVTVGKGLTRGAYQVTVWVKAAGNKTYKSKILSKTFTIKVE